MNYSGKIYAKSFLSQINLEKTSQNVSFKFSQHILNFPDFNIFLIYYLLKLPSRNPKKKSEPVNIYYQTSTKI